VVDIKRQRHCRQRPRLPRMVCVPVYLSNAVCPLPVWVLVVVSVLNRSKSAILFNNLQSLCLCVDKTVLQARYLRISCHTKENARHRARERMYTQRYRIATVTFLLLCIILNPFPFFCQSHAGGVTQTTQKPGSLASNKSGLVSRFLSLSLALSLSRSRRRFQTRTTHISYSYGFVVSASRMRCLSFGLYVLLSRPNSLALSLAHSLA